MLLGKSQEDLEMKIPFDIIAATPLQTAINYASQIMAGYFSYLG